MDVNLFGTFSVTKQFLPLLKKSKGRVINLASIHGFLAVPAHFAYTVSKWGIEAFSVVLRAEMSYFGVGIYLSHAIRYFLY